MVAGKIDNYKIDHEKLAGPAILLRNRRVGRGLTYYYIAERRKRDMLAA